MVICSWQRMGVLLYQDDGFEDSRAFGSCFIMQSFVLGVSDDSYQ